MVSLEFVTVRRAGHRVVALRGQLDVTCSADAVSAIAALIARGQVVIVDMSALEFMDCAGLGALLRVRARARQAGSDVRLVAPPAIVQRLLTLTGADEVFRVYVSVDAAVMSIGFCPGRYVSQRPTVSIARPERAVPLRSESR